MYHRIVKFQQVLVLKRLFVRYMYNKSNLDIENKTWLISGLRPFSDNPCYVILDLHLMKHITEKGTFVVAS